MGFIGWTRSLNYTDVFSIHSSGLSSCKAQSFCSNICSWNVYFNLGWEGLLDTAISCWFAGFVQFALICASTCTLRLIDGNATITDGNASRQSYHNGIRVVSLLKYTRQRYIWAIVGQYENVWIALTVVLHITSHPKGNKDMNLCWRIGDSPGRGEGVFSTRTIRAGEEVGFTQI